MDIDVYQELAERNHDAICEQGVDCHSRNRHIASSFLPDVLLQVIREANKKLLKIEDIMHPGHWSTYDYRRHAILTVLESHRGIWNIDPFEKV